MRHISKVTSVRLGQDDPNEQNLQDMSKPKVAIYRKIGKMLKKCHRVSKTISYYTKTKFNKNKKKNEENKKDQPFFLVTVVDLA